VYPDEDGKVNYKPTQQLDYELEMGFFVSKPVPYGQTLKISEINEHIFGFVLLNDWSSRDIQWYERLPLGPFHGKGQCYPRIFIVEVDDPGRAPRKSCPCSSSKLD